MGHELLPIVKAQAQAQVAMQLSRRRARGMQCQLLPGQSKKDWWIKTHEILVNKYKSAELSWHRCVRMWDHIEHPVQGKESSFMYRIVNQRILAAKLSRIPNLKVKDDSYYEKIYLELNNDFDGMGIS